jgi:spermidine dehydrogenase
MAAISRRDFLNGAALTIASGLTPSHADCATRQRPYPPALTGLRGHHAGSFEAAHDMRDGKIPRLDQVAIEERYDLVVVGAGISGLAAAYFYRKAHPDARILVLDNHDDFGGHAKRNEFTLNRRLILGYGGSESLAIAQGLFSADRQGLLKDLGVDPARFDTAFERKLYPSLGLSRGVFLSARGVRARRARHRRSAGDHGGRSRARLCSMRAASAIHRRLPGLAGKQGAARRAL